jgi:hypothetical protein
MNSCSNRAIPSQIAASISPCVFMPLASLPENAADPQCTQFDTKYRYGAILHLFGKGHAV